ncbi:MAG: acyltransferase family protein [Yonghaparkia sp.]|nr:acyltransferase family protein [Microcella sp.]
MGGPSLSARPRVPLWDTTRFIAITLVVIGHAIQRLIADSDAALVVYLFIYAFHMPLFALISGYFSKPGPPTERRMQRVITDIVIPFLIFETIWTAVQAIVEGNWTLNPTRPSWTLWFLLALGIFRLVLPYLALVRWPLLWAVLISVAVGYFDNVGATFSLARALGILPFFVLGWKLHEWGLIERWRVASPPTVLVRTAAVLVLAAWLAVLIAFIDVWRAIELRYWFFYDESYTGLGVDAWWASLVRLALIGLAVLLSAAVLVLVPRRPVAITPLGQATMYVYLLHSFVLYPIRESGVIGGEDRSGWPWLVGMILFAIAVTALLSTRPVRRVFRPLVEPRPRLLFRPDLDARTGPLLIQPSRTDPTGSRRDRLD